MRNSVFRLSSSGHTEILTFWAQVYLWAVANGAQTMEQKNGLALHTQQVPPPHPLWPQNPFWTHSFMRRMNTKVTFLQAPACPSVLSRLGRVLPVGCDDLESMGCTETALQPA